MSLMLSRPLLFFDIEITRLDAIKDKIIDLAIPKLFPEIKIIIIIISTILFYI